MKVTSFLNKNKNIKSVDEEVNLDVNFKQKARLLPYNAIEDKLNLYELYKSERDACEKYRLVFTINPVCTNVLYNKKTEVVYRNNTDNCQGIIGESKTLCSNYKSVYKAACSTRITNTTSEINHIQAVRDTEYSKSENGGFTYYCGLDILNNHMLRADEFLHINKMQKGDAYSGPVFNTLADYLRLGDGTLVVGMRPFDSSQQFTAHTYAVDNTLTFEEAYNSRIKEKDGWYGFTNPSFIDIKNGDSGTLNLNRLLCENASCEFIDMYPDRSLFSFIPMKNKNRKRIENNWEYCITYPYYSDFTKFNEVSESNTGTTAHNAIRATKEITAAGNGHDVILFKTFIKHNLTYSDSFEVFDSNGNSEVLSVASAGKLDGTDTDHYFKVYVEESKVIATATSSTCYIKKYTNNTPCLYYFRRFKKLLDTNNTLPDSIIGKLAYGENIYGDRMAEITYTDDINVEGLRDNLGRKLTELYLTIVKTNKGHEEWYSNDFSNSKIEGSHCFGKVTSGIETESGETDYNIRKLHNLPDLTAISTTYRAGYKEMFEDLYENRPKTIEDDIILGNKEYFFGDIVEYNPTEAKETVLEHVYHRFNTEQRETANDGYYNIMYDKLISDDYDNGIGFTGYTTTANETKTYNGFEIEGWNTGGTQINKIDGSPYPGNIEPEGYFYNPHYKIEIGRVSDDISSVLATVIDYSTAETVTSYTETNVMYDNSYYIEVVSPSDYSFVCGDLFGLYNKTASTLSWGLLHSYEKVDSGVLLKIETSELIDVNLLKNKTIEIALTDGGVPMYATYLTKQQRFVWREVKDISELDENDELKNDMFTNGRVYMHKNINFFLRRQDPVDEFGLFIPKKDERGNDKSPFSRLKHKGMYIDLSLFNYIALSHIETCM